MRIFSLVVACSCLLAACETSEPRNLGDPEREMPDTEEQISVDQTLLTTLQSDAGAATAPTLKDGKAYSLPELIDVAQQRNPATRQAWLNARIAGRAAGIVESALLPIISASVVAGSAKSKNDLSLAISGVTVPVDVSSSGSFAVLSAQWLLFDFGENAARQQAASEVARISELAFNRVHKQLVFDTSVAYHSRIAGLQKVQFGKSANARADQLLDAAVRRQKAGIGNTVEVAQARQLRAQTQLAARIATGEANAAAVNLRSALNLSPSAPIKISNTNTRLPSADDKRMSALIEGAFSNRPDVLTALAQVRAAQSDMDAVAASYLPKVYAGANIAIGDGGIGLNTLSSGGIDATSSNSVFVGLTVPIYDGRIRESRIKNSQDRLDAATSGVGVVTSLAAREIGLAYEGLRTALAVHSATLELVQAAKVTTIAANEAYVGGLGTLSDASAASLSLFVAEEALADARKGAHHAATVLALATGS